MRRSPNLALVLVPVVTLFSLSIVGTPAFASWIKDGSVVVQKPYNQANSVAIPDGLGGAFVSWWDDRNTPGTDDIYVQRIDSEGNRLWNVDGVAVCTATNHQRDPWMAPDGSGGVILVWYDLRSGTADVYAQRISVLGVPLWTANGLGVCTATNSQLSAKIASDGAGGAYFVWTDYRGDATGDVYAQRVNASGVVQWAANGIPVRATASVTEFTPVTIADGAGNAFVLWSDSRFVDYDIFGQKLGPTGAFLWTAAGRDISNIFGEDEHTPMAVLDGAGGIYAAFRNTTAGNDLYVNRVNSFGTWVWPAVVPVATAANSQTLTSIAATEAGDVLMAWTDLRDEPAGGDVYVQRIAADGTPLWIGDGVPVGVTTGTQGTAQVVSDGASGAIASWWDTRTGVHHIYAQRVDANGTVMWTNNGTPLEQASGASFTRGIVTDGKGGAIVIFDDLRTGSYDVRAQRVEPREGFWGYPEPRIASVADIPGDQGGFVRVNWTRSDHDVIPTVGIAYYSVWRATSAAAAAAASQAAGVTLPEGESIRLVELGDITKDFEGPAFRAAADYYWEYVGQQPAIYSPTYSFAAPTESDQTGQNPAVHYFQVVSHSSTYQTFPSLPVSGASVDNLAPGSPGLLAAMRTTGTNVDLDWSPQAAMVPDFKEYAIYRSDTPGVPVDPGHFLGTTTDTLLVDPGASVSQPFYYVVVAVDIHDNQSLPSNEAMVSGGPTGVGDTPTPRVLTLQPNSPNPFNSSTEFSIGMPQTGSATIEVYNVAGKRVYAETISGLGAGWHRVPFRGRNDQGAQLASGVYFYKLHALGTTVTRKMVVVR